MEVSEMLVVTSSPTHHYEPFTNCCCRVEWSRGWNLTFDIELSVPFSGIWNMWTPFKGTGLVITNEPRHEKTCLQGFRPGTTQTGLLSYRD